MKFGRLIKSIGLIIILAVGGGRNTSAEYSYSDTTIKAAYIINLVDFITFPNQPTNITICVVGDDLIGFALANIQKTENKKNLQILQKSANSMLDACNLVFLSNSHPDDSRRILASTEGLPIVTISDVNKFADKGGIFEFVVIKDRIYFNINISASSKVGLILSPKLKQIANKIIP